MASGAIKPILLSFIEGRECDNEFYPSPRAVVHFNLASMGSDDFVDKG
jgi:hypothetical protein